MASVQLPTKATLSATLLLVVILGSVLCPPCKARQLMQTPEERIDALCDNIENKLKNYYDTSSFFTPRVDRIVEAQLRLLQANAGNARILTAASWHHIQIHMSTGRDTPLTGDTR